MQQQAALGAGGVGGWTLDYCGGGCRVQGCCQTLSTHSGHTAHASTGSITNITRPLSPALSWVNI